MSEALYTKYRPKTFEDVVGQTHVVKTLQNAIDADKISHAYLFCGPRGTGKTTMARLLAKACLCSNPRNKTLPTSSPCGTCPECRSIAQSLHPDVYELDAASRTGVDNVREEIIGRVGFAPTKGSKKIYIIDEVHMLSVAAFNALLKTLEEPPEHVIFILCTTDPQKVPETILSRCQRFDFKSISNDDMVSRMRKICEFENINAEKEALNAIAKKAQGGMRNALTSLEQIIAYTNGDVTLKKINQSSSNTDNTEIAELLTYVGKRDLSSIFDWTDNFCSKGANFIQLTYDLTLIIKKLYILSADSKSERNIPVIYANLLSLFDTQRLHRFLITLHDLNTEYKTTTNERLTFELSMAKLAHPKSDLTLESLDERISQLENKNFNNLENIDITHSVQENTDKTPPTNATIPNTLASSKKQETKNKIADIHTFNTEKAKQGYRASSNNTTNFKMGTMYEEKIESASRKHVNNIQNSRFDNNATNHDSKGLESQKLTDKNVQENTQKNIQSPAMTVPDLKLPNFHTEKKEYNYSKMRKERHDMTQKEHEETQEADLSNSDVLQNVWRAAFSNIRIKYPAYAAFLIAVKVNYDKANDKLVLVFPENYTFAVETIKKPATLQKIQDEITNIAHKKVPISITMSNIKKKEQNFNPQFVNEFRQKPKKQEEKSPIEPAHKASINEQMPNNNSVHIESQQTQTAKTVSNTATDSVAMSDNTNNISTFTNSTNEIQTSSDISSFTSENNETSDNTFAQDNTTTGNNSIAQDKEKMKDMLSSFGAINITEE